jgi:hypothetical protein
MAQSYVAPLVTLVTLVNDQNTASRQVRNLFYLVAVFISFPLARAAWNESTLYPRRWSCLDRVLPVKSLKKVKNVGRVGRSFGVIAWPCWGLWAIIVSSRSFFGGDGFTYVLLCIMVFASIDDLF